LHEAAFAVASGGLISRCIKLQKMKLLTVCATMVAWSEWTGFNVPPDMQQSHHTRVVSISKCTSIGNHKLASRMYCSLCHSF